jgi:hypothetical protein
MTTKLRQQRIPQKGDLIYIKREISGVLSIGNPNDTSPWSTALIMLEPNQTALVLESHEIDRRVIKKDIKSETLIKAQELLNDAIKERDTEDDSIPESFFILLVSIGDHVVETLYDPNYLDVITTPSP